MESMKNCPHTPNHRFSRDGNGVHHTRLPSLRMETHFPVQPLLRSQVGCISTRGSCGPTIHRHSSNRRYCRKAGIVRTDLRLSHPGATSSLPRRPPCQTPSRIRMFPGSARAGRHPHRTSSRWTGVRHPLKIFEGCSQLPMLWWYQPAKIFKVSLRCPAGSYRRGCSFGLELIAQGVDFGLA
jgi:hypothetical protein